MSTDISKTSPGDRVPPKPIVPSVLGEILDDERESLAVASTLRPRQYIKFIRNRRRLLTVAYKILRPISFKRESLFNRMKRIDDFVSKSANAIARSNRTGVVFSVSLAGGLGLSRRLLDKLKEKSSGWFARFLERVLPESGGFYYVLGFGFAMFSRETLSRGRRRRRKLEIELFVDVDRLLQIHTYAAEVSAAVNWGVAMDHSKPTRCEKFDSHYIGILGVIRENADHFSFSLITGLAIPPYFPVGMVYTNRTTRWRLPLLRLPWFS